MLQLKNILLYAGTDRKVFDTIKDKIRESNRKNLIVFSSITVVAMTVMFFQSFFDPSLAVNRTAYALSSLGAMLMVLAAILGKRFPRLIYPDVYVFLSVLFGFGIALGTFMQPNEMTVSFMILLFVVPLLFTDRPIRMSAAILVGVLAYIPAAYFTQDAPMFSRNMVDIEMYGTLSIVVSSYMMIIKVRRIHLETENEFLSKWDPLTGLKNRRSFEDDLNLIRSGKMGIRYFCSFDVNGLKRVNDHHGHAAGDELLQGAASCIRTVFSPYGSCYRTGGDEFIAILDGLVPDPEAILKDFRQETARWSGALVDQLSVSVGIVPVTPQDSLENIITLADKEMYARKTEYYQKHGIQK